MLRDVWLKHVGNHVGTDVLPNQDTIPTLLLSLVYHNVVPTVCAQLEGDRTKITQAVVLGSAVAASLQLSSLLTT